MASSNILASAKMWSHMRPIWSQYSGLELTCIYSKLPSMIFSHGIMWVMACSCLVPEGCTGQHKHNVNDSGSCTQLMQEIHRMSKMLQLLVPGTIEWGDWKQTIDHYCTIMYKLARYNWPHSFSCVARCLKRQISCHNKRYIQLSQSRPCTCHKYWNLYVTMLWSYHVVESSGCKYGGKQCSLLWQKCQNSSKISMDRLIKRDKKMSVSNIIHVSYIRS